MSRQISVPRLADSPGSWLAHFRYRRWIEGEVPSSPEHIGELLGVSGPTIRRWESDRSKPTHFDLQRFADVCHLSSIETSFLITAFSAREHESPPDRDAFVESVNQVLSMPFPANLFDSLFYRRAYNSYMSLLGGANVVPEGSPNALQTMLVRTPHLNQEESQHQGVQRWVHDFWYSTADLCGSMAYRRLLLELKSVSGFAEYWRRIGFDRHEWQSWSFNAPHWLKNADYGDFCVFSSRLVLPPTYHLRVYVPMNEKAMERVQSARKVAPPKTTVDAEIHWSSRLVRSV